MKSKTVSLAVMVLLLNLSACSPVPVTSSASEGPTPVIESESPVQAVPASPASPDLAAQILISIEHVEVQVGVGSPIPVEVVADGTWPDLCSQISEVQSKKNGFQIDVTLLASTTSPCPPDYLGLPFRFALPLNIVEMPKGTYTVTVNGVSTTFDVPVQ